ncbi:myosin regulatory light chain 10 [Alexandromys fortis]|uniref:myosin regulatory light chain 10 n=1 Tax=Alexandromys fortis TaxID=100897 RepID=UPI0021529560|nr:myosin regulatory light chain 10 [Microtus fortis]
MLTDNSWILLTGKRLPCLTPCYCCSLQSRVQLPGFSITLLCLASGKTMEPSNNGLIPVIEREFQPSSPCRCSTELLRRQAWEMRSLSQRAPRRARKRAEGTASSNVFSMFDQSQIQEFKEAFTIMDQNRDGFIDKEDLRDTFAALGRINVKNEELEAMVKEAPGPINFTVFLTMFGEKLKGTDPEETILHAFKVFDTEGKGFVKADFIKEKLMTQADRFSEEEVKQMFAAFPPDVCGNLDYRNLCYVITHGEEKD